MLVAGQRQLREDLVRLADEQLDQSVLTNWGEHWPAWRMFWTMINHDVLHTGAIGHLRDTYHWQNVRT